MNTILFNDQKQHQELVFCGNYEWIYDIMSLSLIYTKDYFCFEFSTGAIN